MEIKEAIEWIKTHHDTQVKTDDSEAMRMAIAALEKQEAKKPKHIDKNKVFDGNWAKVCPTCGRVLLERITTDEVSYTRQYNMTGYCWCGQRIDWSD